MLTFVENYVIILRIIVQLMFLKYDRFLQRNKNFIYTVTE
jgi:hypothetical protein